MEIHSFDDLEKLLRHWTSFQNQYTYDLIGMATLLGACLDNLKMNMIEGDYEQITDCFTEQQEKQLRLICGLIDDSSNRESSE
jgi:hypothetical protein